MDLNFLVNLGKIAGIGGIALGVLLVVFRDVVRKNIFPQLTKDQSFRILRMIILCAFMISAMGIVAWAYATRQEARAGASTPEQPTARTPQQQADLFTQCTDVGGVEPSNPDTLAHYFVTILRKLRYQIEWNRPNTSPGSPKLVGPITDLNTIGKRVILEYDWHRGKIAITPMLVGPSTLGYSLFGSWVQDNGFGCIFLDPETLRGTYSDGVWKSPTDFYGAASISITRVE